MAKWLEVKLLPFIIMKLFNLCDHLAETFIPVDIQEYNENTELRWSSNKCAMHTPILGLCFP